MIIKADEFTEILDSYTIVPKYYGQTLLLIRRYAEAFPGAKAHPTFCSHTVDGYWVARTQDLGDGYRVLCDDHGMPMLAEYHRWSTARAAFEAAKAHLEEHKCYGI